VVLEGDAQFVGYNSVHDAAQRFCEELNYLDFVSHKGIKKCIRQIVRRAEDRVSALID